MTERIAVRALVRIATVLATSRDFPTGAVFERHIGHLADVIQAVPDHPDNPVYPLRIACEAVIEARLNMATADWTTILWRLQRAVHDFAIVAAAQAHEAYLARAG